RGLRDGHPSVVLCASDLFELDEDQVTWALTADGVAVVPSHDGGYSMLASSVPLPELADVPMSTTSTRDELLQALGAAGHTVSVAPFEVPDVDVLDDLPVSELTAD